jgi:hypothetical protein
MHREINGILSKHECVGGSAHDFAGILYRIAAIRI